MEMVSESQIEGFLSKEASKKRYIGEFLEFFLPKFSFEYQGESQDIKALNEYTRKFGSEAVNLYLYGQVGRRLHKVYMRDSLFRVVDSVGLGGMVETILNRTLNRELIEKRVNQDNSDRFIAFNNLDLYMPGIFKRSVGFFRD